MRWSLHFVDFDFFCKEIILTSVQFLGHYPLSVFNQSCQFETPSAKYLSAPRGILIVL